MVDCGLYQGPRELRELNWSLPSQLKATQAIVLTHAHIDHCGLLPRWAQQGFRGPVYCSEGTASLLPVMLMDAARLQEEDARFAAKTKHSRHDPPLPLYTTQDARAALDLIRPVGEREIVALSDSMSLRLLRAGHILGSSVVSLDLAGDASVHQLVFSGDLGSSHSQVLRDPEALTEADTLVMESTYGDRIVDRSQREADLAKFVLRVIGRGGRVVIPSFALGRTQDLLISIYQLQKSGRLPVVPVYVDSPMARQVTAIYRRHAEDEKGEISRDVSLEALSSSWFHTVDDPDDSMLLVQNTEPKIVLSASGMLQGGRVLHHLKHALPRSQDGVLFVGFQGQGTKGRVLLEGTLNLRIHHQEVAVEAEIGHLDGYSAHADQAELMSWLSRMRRRPSRVFLNHGEAEGQIVLSRRIRDLWPETEVIIPQLGSTFAL
jgi:metallo-beta-lactamase family protein